MEMGSTCPEPISPSAINHQGLEALEQLPPHFRCWEEARRWSLYQLLVPHISQSVLTSQKSWPAFPAAVLWLRFDPLLWWSWQQLPPPHCIWIKQNKTNPVSVWDGCRERIHHSGHRGGLSSFSRGLDAKSSPICHIHHAGSGLQQPEICFL